ncbi:putative aspartyl-tRNA synthetase [Leishmania major strain Friedlin]|uniref:aspartate--tRNA ligase n=1 Tax=Leishmania major TaxID=5664 RepID=Q4QCA9_LEIMA|nr:putative aspartyl-tRNA synthetase [Leishmania major strain Friedlin]CAG9573441.1 aspartyl-tRNA_synthetase_-_putative [Leishmania major strain Friedlin]CAJ04412.1 putative aspartyl-tRNA synthetase [Leishmania major strain Friedlin]|eukprot:XP_001683039.1 putative aspartyl-tRNA synthetase [Leishmania major strain Friedlin]
MLRVSLSSCVSCRLRGVAGPTPGVVAAVVVAASSSAVPKRWTSLPNSQVSTQRLCGTSSSATQGASSIRSPHCTSLSPPSTPSAAPTETATLTNGAISGGGCGRACLAAHGASIASLRAAFNGSCGESGCVREGDEVTVRARLERTRGRGKLAFLHLRQPPLESVQAVCEGKELTKQARSITLESIVDVTGIVRRADTPVQSTTCQGWELQVTALHVVSQAATPLPFPYRDTNARLDTRLNHRVMDLRTEKMIAASRLVSALGQSFRNELLARDFIEVHTPKLLGAASEGGSNVFRVDYFERKAYLAQSPQLHKQMMVMGDAMRVFEVGPVFRAENSLTHRHLTEFVGLDGEMVIKDSHTEVLDVLEPVMCAVLAHLTQQHGNLIDALWKQQQQQGEGLQTSGGDPQPATAAEPPRCGSRGHAPRDVCCEVALERMTPLGITTDASPTTRTPFKIPAQVDPYHARVGGDGSGCRVLRMSFADASQLLAGCGGPEDMADCTLPVEDFTLPQERRLGQLIKERYGVDLYVIDSFPSSARPFYTMPVDPSMPDGPTRSYDMYLRGEEICSGAQRVHQIELLEQRLSAKKVDKVSVKDYVDSFRYGAWPHGGFGLGLERIALFFLGLDDIRQVSLFPRDPKRISP